ncbi:hypothetical protein B0H19DRAFT_1189447 [Mycena capillaripes]|nr:hypothetical protein B0H19DRAFT_1189447 [Mycena capillaripes]
MHRLPYLISKVNDRDRGAIIDRTAFADYTSKRHLKEGRRPYPYQYLGGCPDIDAWLLPLTLPSRDGWHVMLDTQLGVIRAYSTYNPVSENTVEWKRHAVPNEERDQAEWTEYRRAPLVPAARYFSELIYAYSSLSRLPVINGDLNDPKDEGSDWRSNEEREKQQTLLVLYRECGWPDEWRRAEFLAKWEIEARDIAARARQARELEFASEIGSDDLEID